MTTTLLDGAPDLGVGLQKADELAGGQAEGLPCRCVAALCRVQRVQRGGNDEGIAGVLLAHREFAIGGAPGDKLRGQLGRPQIEGQAKLHRQGVPKPSQGLEAVLLPVARFHSLGEDAGRTVMQPDGRLHFVAVLAARTAGPKMIFIAVPQENLIVLTEPGVPVHNFHAHHHAPRREGGKGLAISCPLAYLALGCLHY